MTQNIIEHAVALVAVADFWRTDLLSGRSKHLLQSHFQFVKLKRFCYVVLSTVAQRGFGIFEILIAGQETKLAIDFALMNEFEHLNTVALRHSYIAQNNFRAFFFDYFFCSFSVICAQNSVKPKISGCELAFNDVNCGNIVIADQKSHVSPPHRGSISQCVRRRTRGWRYAADHCGCI